jgi:mannose-1-phosphate guanylyltransferase
MKFTTQKRSVDVIMEKLTKMNLAEIESYWNKRGHFNIQLYINYLRAKNEKLQSNTERQVLQDSEGIRSTTCIPDGRQMDRFNLKN